MDAFNRQPVLVVGKRLLKTAGISTRKSGYGHKRVTHDRARGLHVAHVVAAGMEPGLSSAQIESDKLSRERKIKVRTVRFSSPSSTWPSALRDRVEVRRGVEVDGRERVDASETRRRAQNAPGYYRPPSSKPS